MIHGKFNKIICLLAFVGALVLGVSSTATAQEPIWDNQYNGTGVTKFHVNGCGKTPKDTDDVVVNLWGPTNNPTGYEHENGTWGVSILDSQDPADNYRVAGTINDVSRNGRNLYLDFYQGSRTKLSDLLQEVKGILCEIASPLPDEVIWRQARVKTNKLSTRIQVRFRAAYQAVVNDGGRTRRAAFQLNMSANSVY